jgi:hypothetical protein
VDECVCAHSVVNSFEYRARVSVRCPMRVGREAQQSQPLVSAELELLWSKLSRSCNTLSALIDVFSAVSDRK